MGELIIRPPTGGDTGERKRAYIYRPDEVVQVVDNPSFLSAGSVLADFELDLREVW